MKIPFTKKLAAGLAALGIASVAFGAVGTADAGRGRLVGAWEIAVVPSAGDTTFVDVAFLNALVVSRDGTLVNTGPGARAGVGAWEKTGKRTYTLHVVHPIDTATAVVEDDAGDLVPEYGTKDLVYDIVVELTLSKDGHSASGTYDTDVRRADVVASGGGFDIEYSDPLAQFGGIVEYDRIDIHRD